MIQYESFNVIVGCPLALSFTNMVSSMILLSYIVFSGVYKQTWSSWSREALQSWGEYLSTSII